MLVDQIQELLEDLETLTEFELTDWIITHDGNEITFDKEKLVKMLDLSPHVYRINHEEDELDDGLNEMRLTANLYIKPQVDRTKIDSEIENIMVQAGII